MPARRRDDGEGGALQRIVGLLGIYLEQFPRSSAPKLVTQARDEAGALLRRRQDATLQTSARTDDGPAASPQKRHRPGIRPAEQMRRRVFALTRPTTLLEPANIVAVYLGGHPMWPSWAWADTEAVNAGMLRFLQEIDPADPLADEPGVALPLTAAGFYLYRALCCEPDPDLTANVYREIADGVVMVDKLLIDAIDRKLRGELSEAVLADVAHVADFAHQVLFHAVRLGLDAWGQQVLRRCDLEAHCKRARPYYVNRPGALRGNQDAHAACRQALKRTRERRPGTVTTMRAKRKK